MLAMLSAEKVECPLDLALAASCWKRRVEVLPMRVEGVDERINSGAFGCAGRDDRCFPVGIPAALGACCMGGSKGTAEVSDGTVYLGSP